MKRLKQLLTSRKWLVIPPILIGVAMLWFFASQKKDLPRRDQADPIGEREVTVTVEEVQLVPVQPQAIGYGTAEPGRRWTAVAEIQGRITSLHPELDSGHLVEQGAELLVIDDLDYRLRERQRLADYDAAVARVAELKASQTADQKSLEIEETLLEVNRTDLNRYLSLRSNRTIAESEYEQAREIVLRQTQSVQKLRNTLSLYASKIASAEASVALADSRLREARRDIERTIVTSPFAGRLAGVSLELGQFVSTGERLFEVQDSRHIEIPAQFSLAQLDRLLPQGAVAYKDSSWESIQSLNSLTADVIVRSGKVQLSWAGRPVRFSEQVDPRTRTRGIVVEVINPTADASSVSMSDVPAVNPQRNASKSAPLLPGTFCEVHLRRPLAREVISVPRSALDGDIVYTVDYTDGSSRLKRNIVRRGISLGERISIADGLEAGELVVIKPPVPAIDGQSVQVVRLSGAQDNFDSQDSGTTPPAGGINSASGYPTAELPSARQVSSARSLEKP